MSRSDRDPLFFPPNKYPEDGDSEPPEYSAETDPRTQQRGLRLVILGGAVVLVLFFLAMRWASIGATWSDLRALGSASPAKLSDRDLAAFDRMPPQEQAERLLDRALAHSSGATDQLFARADSWRGQLQKTATLQRLESAAFDANDLTLRAAAIEVELAALKVPKEAASVTRLIPQAEPGQPQRTLALWELGLLAARGVEPVRARQALLAYLHDPQEEVRAWAVQGLAFTGQDESIPPLLEALHNDPAARLREAAARDLGHAGMLTHDQRLTAVPALLGFTDDPALDPATRALIFQTLREITGQSLPADPAAWRKWWDTRAK
jgi:HEAT repeat protein